MIDHKFTVTRTEHDGVSGGVGILVDKGITAGPLPHKGPHAHRWAPYSVAGKMGDWVFVVVYGYPSSRMCPLNQALHKEVADWVAGQGNVRIVIGGDWQVSPETISPDGAKTTLGHVLDPGEPTCVTKEGNRQTAIDFFIVNDAARHEVHSWGGPGRSPGHPPDVHH